MVWLKTKAFICLLACTSLTMGNHENEKIYDPPCFFNPLCVCSKAYPDLGRVSCKNIPLLTIPKQINTSKVFTLHLENNGLRHIEPYFFRQTGLFKIEITRNFLTEISEETFSGLERSLWELNLQGNKFKKVPGPSLRGLQKLKILDLSDNEITIIRSEDWIGLEGSLETLILSDNKLSSLRPRTFSVLQKLESLDLSSNALYELDNLAFKDGSMQLNDLNLANNLFTSIPFQQLSDLRQLRHLDLSFNQITEIHDVRLDYSKKKFVTLYLDTLRLDYNQIQYLSVESFKSFPVVNRTYLNGNPISFFEKDAFLHTHVRELYLKDCEMSELGTDILSGLQNSLEVLDLEGNNVTNLPLHFLKEFNNLKSLNLKDNFINEIDSEKIFDDPKPSLQFLDLRGYQNPVVNCQQLHKLDNLRSLALSKLSDTSLSSDDFPDFLSELEELKISYSNIRNLKSHAFKNVRGLRRLDLSENSILTIENEAFSEIGHSLTHLSLANGLSSDFNQLPLNAFDDLSSVEYLDLSNNKIKILPQRLFHSMKRLKKVLLQDNSIEFIPKGAFLGEIHYELITIQLSFNQLSLIDRQTFIGLNKLKDLWLNDNRITTIERGAFVNLYKLRNLYLRGNKINLLKEESFQGLPELEKLDLAYNKLTIFNYACLEQVGTLSSFTLNVSNNNIIQLTSNLSSSDYSSIAPVHALDLSHNNISHVDERFFKPVESSITYLYLSHNKLHNITRNVFGNMKHLQWLDVSHNFITNLEFDSFANTQSIQVIDLSDNRLKEVPRGLFKGFHSLRLLDLSNNRLRSLPESLFDDGIVEKLDLSRNLLTRLPFDSFDADSAAVLTELDLSTNSIVALPPTGIFTVFKNLYWLNLSKNRIIRIEDGTFSHLNRLHFLDLSHNTDLTLDPMGRTFDGLNDTLEELILKNLSLHAIPTLRLNSLLNLDVSGNKILTIPFEFSHNLSQLERIELRRNQMVTLPPAISVLNKLQYLGIADNPLESVNFQQSFRLRELDLRNISLTAIEEGAFAKIPLLETLRLSVHYNVQDVSLPYLLKDNYGLKSLYIEITGNDVTSLEGTMSGSFSTKLQNLNIAGRGLKRIPKNLLRGIQSSWLNLTLFNTSVEEISKEVFDNAGKVRNLTLDVRSNKFKTMYNPNTADFPNTPKEMFLLDLQISNNDWICDCSIGWIEGWERKRRQYLCEDYMDECFLGSDDLRETVCSNRKPNTMVEVFKSELECGWNGSNYLKATILLEFLSLNTLFWVYIRKL